MSSTTMTRHVISRPDGALISYQLCGDPDDPPVTLIQGLGMPGGAWRRQGLALARRGFFCLLIDNRGTGHSTSRARPFTLPTLADDAAAVMREVLGEAKRSHVIGISLGGMIAQHLALRHPERIAGLMLLATTCGLPHNLLEGAFFTPAALLLLGRIMFARKEPSLEQMHQLLAHRDNGDRVAEVMLEWQRMLLKQPTAAATVPLQLLAATLHSTGGRLDQIPHRTYVISGDEDFLIPPRNSEILARRLPDARHIVIERAGHIFPQEHPEAIEPYMLELHRETSHLFS